MSRYKRKNKFIAGDKVYILKNSEKYTVFKIKNRKKFFVLKVSNRSPSKIFREINHIKKLKKTSNFFSQKIPSIVKYGKIKKGINKHKGYYQMIYVKGPTLSEIFQKNQFYNINKIKLFEHLSDSLINEVRNAKCIKKKNAFELFRKLLLEEYKKIIDKNLFKNLLSRKNILVNNKSYLNISYCLRKIFLSKNIKYLRKKYNFICKINHWNFHGGNIIFFQKSKKISN